MADRKEQLRLERERRQARIREAGSNRLSKITNLAGSKDFKPPVAANHTTTAVSTSAPNANTTAPNTTASLSAPSTASGTAGSTATGQTSPSKTVTPAGPSDPMNDPFAALLQAASNGGGLGNLAELLGMQQPPAHQTSAPQQQQQPPQPQPQPRSPKTDYSWELAHFLIAVLVGLYAALVNPWNSLALFIAVQIAQVSAQVYLGHTSTGLPKFVNMFVGMLPRQRQRQLYTISGVIGAFNTAYRDFSVVLVVFGVFSLGGRDYARPLLN